MRWISVIGIALATAMYVAFPRLVAGQAQAGPPAGSDAEVSEINREAACNVLAPSVLAEDDTDHKRLRAADTTLITNLSLSRVPPCQPNLPGPISLENLQHGFDFFSWLTFIALNSPADALPGDQSSILSGDKATVWERYRQLPDVMLADGSDPGEWDLKANQRVPLACRRLAGADKLLIHMEEETFNQPFKTGPLIDQNGHYALFTIFMNEQMYNYIRANNLYSVEGQRDFRHGTDKFSGSTVPPGDDMDPVVPEAAIVNFPNGKIFRDAEKNPTGRGTMGSVMLKVSWKVLDRSDHGRFHRKQALIYTPASADGRVQETCVERTVGMIGFHVGHKTVDRRQWIWTTFEHVSNVPTEEELKAGKARGKSYNFFDPRCDEKKCVVNATPPRPWHPGLQNKGTTLKFGDDAYRSQIVRVISLDKDVEENLNPKFRSRLRGSVWENYMLVSTQWPAQFPCSTQSNTRKQVDPTCQPAPIFLANTTLETYSQGRVPLASSSCIACHGNATTQNIPATPSDFTFILEKAKKRLP